MTIITCKGRSGQEILSQAVLFLLAGYDTTANTLGYLIYSLALNPECQEKVYDEAHRVVGDKVSVFKHCRHLFMPLYGIH